MLRAASSDELCLIISKALTEVSRASTSVAIAKEALPSVLGLAVSPLIMALGRWALK